MARRYMDPATPRMILVLVVTFCHALILQIASVGGFSSYSTFLSRNPSSGFLSPPRRRQVQTTGATSAGGGSLRFLYMRDASASYWFQVGDRVRVVADDVLKAGVNLYDRVGTVVETWEKCDVDPTCCCAEQVDINMAVRVQFEGTEADPTAIETKFLHYFAEAELLKVKEE